MKVEFKPPKEYTAPEGKQAGDTFEDVATFRIKPDGTLCLVEIGGIDMPGYEDKEDEGRPTSRAFIQKNMMGGGDMAAPAGY